MLRLWSVFVLVCVLFVWSAPVRAQTSAIDQVVAQLKEQGYETIEVRRTLLGRYWIIADAEDIHREIVINPRTNEILRDFWTRSEDDDEPIIANVRPKEKLRKSSSKRKSTSRKQADDDDDDDDDDEDRDDDDDDDDDREDD